ncbi:transcription factor of the MADS box [Malassezia caprae]|uniref:Transcription factor of the MADS box n=1 Tax=Malassezia caprae TaxID=1381934 RepID=A0AAF0IXB6_9BASI|nr:transcription factor of the MADS box [Malassezia caprae]
MYPIPSGSLPLGQPFEPMAPQGAAWPFPIASMPGGQGGLPNAGGIVAMPPNFAPGIAPDNSVPTADPGADASNVSTDSQAPTHPLPADTTPTPANAPQTQDQEATRTNGRRRSQARSEKDIQTGRRKIKIEYIDDDARRHITFSKRKAGIMKKAYELATLTGTQVLLLVVSQTGLVYTFTTPKLEAVVKEPEGRNLIQECLNAPDASETPFVAGPSSAPLKEPHASAVPFEDPSSERPVKVAADDGDEAEEDEDEEEEGLDVGRADAGLSSQAMGAVPMSPFAPPVGAPLFHPGWSPAVMGKRADGKQNGESSHHAALKRRRTQPNLSVRSSHDMAPSLYQPMMPVPPLDHSALPMLYGSPSVNTAPLPDKGESPTNNADAPLTPSQEGPRSS